MTLLMSNGEFGSASSCRLMDAVKASLARRQQHAGVSGNASQGLPRQSRHMHLSQAVGSGRSCIEQSYWDATPVCCLSQPEG